MTLRLAASAEGYLTAYRIVKKKYTQSAFDGEGARLHGGRWNSKGSSAVYLADSVPLAILEILVHVDDQESLRNWCMFEVLIPEAQILELPFGSLPEDWRENPPPGSTMLMGDAWLGSGHMLALKVPSTVVPMGGFSLVLNPSHPSFENIVNGLDWQPVEVDPRLLE